MPESHFRRAAFLLPAVLLSSCLTTALWGGSIEDEDNDGVDEVSLRPEVDGTSDLLLKIVLTPVTLAFDICTSPIQAWMYGWDEDDDIVTSGEIR